MEKIIEDDTENRLEDDNRDEYVEENDEEEMISNDIIPIEDVYKQNIGTLSSLNNLKEEADNRFKERKLSFAKHSGALKIIIIAIISIIIFHYRTNINNFILNRLTNNGFILESLPTSINFIVKNLHIIIFLYFTRILPLILDLFVIFIIDILDLFIFIISRFDYHIALKSRKIEQLLKNKKNKKDNNSAKDYVIISINGILYVLIMGMLIPINLIIKGTSLIAKLTEGVYNFILPQNEIIKKIQPSRNIKRAKKLANTVDKLAEGKKIVKQQEQKRGFFNNLKDKIKKYLDNIIDKNDLLTNSLRDNKGKIAGKAPGRKRIIEKGGRSLGGKSRGKGRDEFKSTGYDRKTPDGETKEPQTRDDREQNNQIKRDVDDNIRYQKVETDNNILQQRETQQDRQPQQRTNDDADIKYSERIPKREQQERYNNTAITPDREKQPYLQQNINSNKNQEEQLSIDMEELYDLFTEGIVRDDNGNGVGGIFNEKEAYEIASRVIETKIIKEGKSEQSNKVYSEEVYMNRIKHSEGQKTEEEDKKNRITNLRAKIDKNKKLREHQKESGIETKKLNSIANDSLANDSLANASKEISTKAITLHLPKQTGSAGRQNSTIRGL